MGGEKKNEGKRRKQEGVAVEGRGAGGSKKKKGKRGGRGRKEKSKARVNKKRCNNRIYEVHQTHYYRMQGIRDWPVLFIIHQVQRTASYGMPWQEQGVCAVAAVVCRHTNSQLSAHNSTSDPSTVIR